MSLPIYNLTCTDCDYADSFYFDVWYEFEEGRDAPCQPHLGQAWCRECDKAITYCGPETDETARSELNELREIVQTEEQKGRGKRFLIFSRRPNTEVINALQKRIEDINSCIAHFALIRTVPRCLTCGSTSLVEINWPDRGIEIPIAAHRCGGKILARQGGRISLSSSRSVIYDIRGNIVEDSRDA